jgi:hypothetical protein
MKNDKHHMLKPGGDSQSVTIQDSRRAIESVEPNSDSAGLHTTIYSYRYSYRLNQQQQQQQPGTWYISSLVTHFIHPRNKYMISTMNSLKTYFPFYYVAVLLILSLATGISAGGDTTDSSDGRSLNVNSISLLRSSYRDQYLRNLQELKQSYQESVREVINAVQLQHLVGNQNGNKLQRQMQDLSLCNSDGIVNFDDEFNMNAFDSRNIFNTMCTCVDGRNMMFR